VTISFSFSELWQAYPKEQSPCTGSWANQCAIRMSIALEGAGFSLATYTDPTCAHGHARGAESLANFLWSNLRAAKKVSDIQRIKPFRGIVFFKNIKGFREGQGSHIDLWDKGKTKTGAYASRSKEIWFWSL